MMLNQQISAVIITDNYHPKLESALWSVRHFDQILVVLTQVDSQLKNKLLSLTKVQKKIELLIYPNKVGEGFDQLRNWSMEKAKFDWVFFVDSDEELIGGGLEEMKKWLTINVNSDGASVWRSDWLWGKQLRFGEAGRQKVVRLVNREQVRFKGKVHEVAKLTQDAAILSVYLWHYSHPNLGQFWQKIVDYANLVADASQPNIFTITSKLLIYPPAKFCYNLIIKSGWKDGWRGLAYAVMMSFHSLLVRLFQLEKYYEQKYA